MSARRRPMVLNVDPIACEGHGVCAELLPEWIRLDDWGYPILNRDAVPAELLDQAKWAVSNCPALALSLRAVPVAPATTHSTTQSTSHATSHATTHSTTHSTLSTRRYPPR